MDTLDTDVCVVGGGPAGLTLALLMLRSGVRVAVAERSPSADREYRGEILQPGGLALLDELGVLAGARERGAHELSRFQLMENGRPVLDIDYRALPGPYDHLLSLPQPHLLAELLEQCARFGGFDYLAGHRVTELVADGDRTTGVRIGDRLTVRAQCVVGADGRYSQVRRLAGIDAGRQDVFDMDVAWLKIPDPGGPRPAVQIFRSGAGPVLAYSSYPGLLQLGWCLPHGTWPELAGRGIDEVRERIARSIPAYADAVHEHVRSLRDISLLDVFAGHAPEWVRDGLVLIGDSAHTHSPLGAQGINLAIQDAAVLHPILLDCLSAGDTSAAALSRYAQLRQPDIAVVMKIQRMQSRGMLTDGALAAARRRVAGVVIGHTPIRHVMTRQIAFGRRPIGVRADLFQPVTRR